MVYLEASASMAKFENKDGVEITSLNLTQRKSPRPLLSGGEI